MSMKQLIGKSKTNIDYGNCFRLRKRDKSNNCIGRI